MKTPSNPNLKELQHWMDQILRHVRGIEFAVEESKSEEKIQQWIEGSDIGDRFQRLGIYGSGYFIRLSETLADIFPRMAWSLGEEKFNRLVSEYVDEYPSTSPNSMDLYQNMEAFIASSHWLEEHPYLLELAQLERLVLEAFFAPEGKDDLSLLQQISPEAWPQMAFEIHPSVRVLNANWRVDEVWAEKRRVPEKGGLSLLIHRSAFGVEHETRVVGINDVEKQLLDLMQQGKNLERIFEEVINLTPETLNKIFEDWTRFRVIQRILLKKS